MVTSATGFAARNASYQGTATTVIVPVKNDAARLANCLAAVANNWRGASGLEVIVVDNGSTDDSRAVAASAGARVLVMPGGPVSQLRNAGAVQAVGSILAFIDADHEIVSTWLDAATDALADEAVGAAGALYTSPEQGTWVQQMYGVLRGRTVGRTEVAWLGSGNLVVRRRAFEQVGGFDPSLEACEDVDLCRRLRAAGWKIMGDERLRSVHLGDPPTLGALFRAERWRGRDNFRVSLRGRVLARDIPSLIVPIVTVLALLALIVSPLSAFVGAPAPWVAGLAGIAILGQAGLQAMRMLFLARSASPVFFAQALAVAMTYDLARGIALVTRTPHHRR